MVDEDQVPVLKINFVILARLVSFALGKMDSHQAMAKQNLHPLAGVCCSPEVLTRILIESWTSTGLLWHTQHSICLGVRLVYFDLAVSSVISNRKGSHTG